MRFLATILLTIGLQLALGALICVAATPLVSRSFRGMQSQRRRRAAIRARAATSLVRSLPLAVGLSLVGAAVRVALGDEPGGPAAWAGPVILVVLGSISTSGGYLLLHAAHLEAGGRLRRARRQVRPGGRLMFRGVLLLLAALGAGLLFHSGFRREMLGGTSLDATILLSAALALAAAALVGLLAGLSGKPRPSAGFAVLLYFCGLAGLLYAAG